MQQPLADRGLKRDEACHPYRSFGVYPLKLDFFGSAFAYAGILFLCVLVLTGCSGGGSSSSGTETPVTNTPAPAFTVSAAAAANGSEGALVEIAASSSGADGAVSYAWRQIEGPAAVLWGEDTLDLSAQLPLVPAETTVTFEVTGTDASGGTSTATATMLVLPRDGASLLEMEARVDGVRRSYTIYTPAEVVEAPPLVIFLHGAGGNMQEFIADGETPADWMNLADRDGFIVVYPNGYSNEDGDGLGDSQSWNDLNGRLSSGDDLGFLRALIEEVVVGRNIDPDKVLVGGRSNGAMMAFRMAIEATASVKAIAAFVGNLAQDPIPAPTASPLPATFIFGAMEDPVLPYGGNANNRSIPETVDYFVEGTLSDTSIAPPRVALDDAAPSDGCQLFQETYQNGAGLMSVQFLEGEGSGHYIPDPDFEQSQQNIAGRGPVICRDANGIELAHAFFTDVINETPVSVIDMPAPPADGASSSDFSSGAQGLFVGQSFFVPVGTAFNESVTAGNFPDHTFQAVFAGGASGSPQALWENEERRAEIEQILATGQVQLFGKTIGELNEDNPAEFYGRWADLAISYNPETAIFIGFPYLQGGPNKDSTPYDEEITQGGENFFPIVEGLRGLYPDNPIYYINYGKVLSQMKAEFESGELEDLDFLSPSGNADTGEDPLYLFSDNGVGHSGPMGEHISGLVWAHFFYGADIETLVDPSYSAEDVLRIANDVIEFNLRYQ
ncbi:MAG: PHB depolymerase family esterase [Pseudomonadota bacterium]